LPGLYHEMSETQVDCGCSGRRLIPAVAVQQISGSNISMKILTISTVFPYPPQDGTKIQIFQRVRCLSETSDVTLLCIVDALPEQVWVDEMQKYCNVQLMMRPVIQLSSGAIERAYNFIHSLVTGIPYYERGHFRRDVGAWIQRAVRTKEFDVVEGDVHAGIYLRGPLNALKVWILHSVSDSNEKRSIRFARDWKNWLTLSCYRVVSRRYERVTARRVDLVVVLTPENEADLKQVDPNINVKNCLTNGVDLDYFRYEPEAEEPQGVCFVGKMDYLPNNDAVLHFYRNIWPEVREKAPHSRLLVIGSNPLPEVVELAKDPSVEVSGFVEDVRPLIRKAGIAVVPVRMGGGILNKVLEAMAMGVPVVASRIAIHGLKVEPGREILVCDSDEEFAANVIRLLSNSQFRVQMSAAGRQYVEAYHKWRPIVGRYRSALDTLVIQKRKSQVEFQTLPLKQA